MSINSFQSELVLFLKKDSLPKSHGEFISFTTVTSIGRHFNVGITLHREGSLTLTPGSSISRFAGTISPVISFSHQPRGTSSIIQACHFLTTSQFDRTIFASPTFFTGAIVIIDAICNKRIQNMHNALHIKGKKN